MAAARALPMRSILLERVWVLLDYQVVPLFEVLAALPVEIGVADTVPAGNGYFGATVVTACIEPELTPLLAAGREPRLASGHACLRSRAPTCSQADGLGVNASAVLGIDVSTLVSHGIPER